MRGKEINYKIMKKFTLLLLVLVLMMSACEFSFNLGGDKEEGDNVSEESFVPEDKEQDSDDDEDDDDVEEDDDDDDDKDAAIKELEEKVAQLEEKLEASDQELKETVKSADNYITLDSPGSDDEFYEAPIEFTGSVSPGTERIVVKATVGTDCQPGDLCVAPYYEDVYTLQDFEPGDTEFIYRANEDWDNLTHGTNDYEFRAYFEDGSMKTTEVSIYYYMGGPEMAKPVIYLYPEETGRFYVNVEPTAGISVSDPEIGEGWNIVSTPESKIFNYGDGKVYPYLFWEGSSWEFDSPEEGFVVAQEDVEEFFDEKLAVLGLNEVEIADFNEFWVDKFEDSPYYFFTFLPQYDLDRYAPLTVEPRPDTVIRVFMDYRELDEKIEVKEQKLVTPERRGFTVTEWGGAMYK